MKIHHHTTSGSSGNPNVRKYHKDIDVVRYPRDVFSIDYKNNDNVDHFCDLKFFYKEYVAEEILDSFISYTDMKNEYPIQFLDLRFQVDHNNPQKIQLFEKYRGATKNVRLFMILIRQREIKIISDWNKITKVNII